MMKIPVLYIGGWGRSGSTLLGNVLGSIDGFQHIGEITYIWEHGWKYNHLCGCGTNFQECNFWKQVVKKAFSEKEIDIDKMIWIRNRYLSNKKVLWCLFTNKKVTQEINEYIDNLDKLYQAIYSVGNCRVIIDSSKIPIQAYILLLLNNIDLHILHLIRDARGCAFSWSKKIYREDAYLNQKIEFEKYDAIHSTLKWDFWNSIFELFKLKVKYIRIKYENFILDPISTLHNIARFVGFSVPWEKKEDIILKINHTVWGNPSRMKTGRVNFSLDEAWRKSMPLTDRLLVTSLSWPWLLYYGYWR